MRHADRKFMKIAIERNYLKRAQAEQLLVARLHRQKDRRELVKLWPRHLESIEQSTASEEAALDVRQRDPLIVPRRDAMACASGARLLRRCFGPRQLDAPKLAP